jgi:hypothetical protein
LIVTESSELRELFGVVEFRIIPETPPELWRGEGKEGKMRKRRG